MSGFNALTDVTIEVNLTHNEDGSLCREDFIEACTKAFLMIDQEAAVDEEHRSPSGEIRVARPGGYLTAGRWKLGW